MSRAWAKTPDDFAVKAGRKDVTLDRDHRAVAMLGERVEVIGAAGERGLHRHIDPREIGIVGNVHAIGGSDEFGGIVAGQRLCRIVRRNGMPGRVVKHDRIGRILIHRGDGLAQNLRIHLQELSTYSPKELRMTPDRIVEFAEELTRVAAAGGGAKALAAHLSDATGVGVLVEDAEWRHVATAGKGSLPATARGQNNGRAHTVPIAAGTNQLGFLSVFPGPDGVDDDLARIVRLAAAAIALELSREADGGRSRRRTFWERLIGGAYHEHQLRA